MRAFAIDEFEEFEAEISRSSKPYVVWLQKALNQVMGLRLTVDGVIGSQTRSAIRSFQQRSGLAVDGIVGAKTEQALIAAGSPQPPSLAAADPPGKTAYLDIRLGGEAPAKAQTGIFVPDGYRQSESADIIVYLHGHKTSFPNTSIEGYWNAAANPQWALREGLNDSGKNAILIAPTLGPKSQAGTLVSGGGFDTYLDRVMSGAVSKGLLEEGTQVRNIILSCHSGGGLPMRTIANGSDRAASQIRECWGFDCLYNTGDASVWTRWAKVDPGFRRLYVYFLGSTVTQSTLLANARVLNVTVEKSTARGGHNWVPIEHWKDRIQAAPFLEDR